MGTHFSNNSFASKVYKHNSLPVYISDEFTFYRCVNVEDWVYGTTISKLHSGNLRLNDMNGRYSKLFPDEKISYWADYKSTALAEIRRHKGNKNYLTFQAYDDVSSTFPSLGVAEDLIIIDGREVGFSSILLKIEEGIEISAEEEGIVREIKELEPDCLAYNSVAKEGGVNFLFFEKGFKKLALREVQLYLGEGGKKNSKTIACAITCDYSPVISSYGKYFEPIARVKDDSDYCNTDEYQLRNRYYMESLGRISRFYEGLKRNELD
ncbi:MAG: hypothetical protein FH761_11290 [Firmicutes bacterium]|nr:hypothetical protein [Bacillota bacterium]